MQIDVKVKTRKTGEPRLGPGLRVVAPDGTAYVTVGPRGSTLKRERPKARGKAARREDKRRRLEARARAEQLLERNRKQQEQARQAAFEAWCQEQSEL
jgi:hypothetical protein